MGPGLRVVSPEVSQGFGGCLVAIAATVLAAYAQAAARAQRFFTSPRAVRLVNRGSGVVMAGAAATIVTR